MYGLPEDDTQVQGESIMDDIASKFRLSNGDVDLEDFPDEAPVPRNCYLATQLYMHVCMYKTLC